ncbi:MULTISPECIES: hypothetical protein [Pandoraea]|jgi:hypothetical protein|uniref:Uncharacterized protein n=2 Tax=Pandoraea TaxID=93217 RepID=A0A378Y9L3_9BURK|nr:MULTISPECIES: hypothetical protein [Pandoraea]AHB08489.1 hypothetical protein U875_13830 [Pandoraea pnomenusa 3kgm]AHB78722.1 hypothetical protein X636_21025 [Pandoraea pnomenusa]AHN77347.1 hypothetical protein DA70_06065 [Pandoraea pnomenusa]AIU25187.1 hypothetical protein LV28_00200 [Pandoraea pnomenusa]ANC46312.1 hypothetical protein A6P55_21150 [Pandoraea pnomenusa]
MKLILLALAASLFTLVMMVQARSETSDVAANDKRTSSGISVNDRTPTRKDMAMWNARRKMHAVRQED